MATSTRRRLLLAVVAFALVLLPSSVLTGAATAAATPGTWGAGRYQFSDGRVCSNGSVSTPLASWDVEGGHRGFLVQNVVSDGLTDSAAPPIASAGTALPPQPDPGLTSPSDSAALAYLISTSPDSAGVAATVLLLADPGGLPGCADSGTVARLLADARSHAGPYTVQVIPDATTARPGGAIGVHAVVTNQDDAPVPGVSVRFDAGPATTAGTALTDASGIARTSVAVGAGVLADTLTVTASASVPTTLLEATIAASPSATDPSGTSVPAVYAGPPDRYSGSVALPVDQTPHPVATTTVPNRLVHTGTEVVPTVAVTGLRNHAAQAAVTVLGPLAIPPGGCGTVPAAAFTDRSPVVMTDTADRTGDGPVTVSSFTPAKAGCFAVRTVVTVTDLPAPVRAGVPVLVVAALATAVHATAVHAVVLARDAIDHTVNGSVAVEGLSGYAARLLVRWTGPIAPADGNCSANVAAWQNAPTSVTAASGQVDGDGTYGYRSTAPAKVGCYRSAPELQLRDSDSAATLTVPAATPTPVFVLAPTLTAQVDRTSWLAHRPVRMMVTVGGLFRQAAHVRVSAYARPPDPFGCGHADYRGAPLASVGPAVPVPVDSFDMPTFSAPSSAVAMGCYAVTARVTLDAAHTVTLSTPLGDPQAILLVAADARGLHAAPKQPPLPDASWRLWLVTAVFAALVAAAVGWALAVARRDTAPASAFAGDLLLPDDPGA